MAVLIRASTYYQLINAINIKQSFFVQEDADLVLNRSTDFSVIRPRVEEMGLFRQIVISPDSLEENRAFRRMRPADKRAISKAPDKLVKSLPLRWDYTDLYLPTDDEYNKLFYYNMLKRGCTPALHIYEDGLATYTLNIEERAENDAMAHGHYNSHAFLNQLKEILVYEPELYCAPVPCSVNRLPKLNGDDRTQVLQYTSIFGQESMPEEPVIFLMEGFHADRMNTSDLDILDYIAGLCGKENIIIKMHPRDRDDWLAAKGYKMFPQSKIPWEIMLLTNSLNGKLLLSISSTAVVSPQIVLGKSAIAMHLYSVREIGTSLFLKQPVTAEYYRRLTKLLNREQFNFFVPNSVEMLGETIRYLKIRGRI